MTSCARSSSAVMPANMTAILPRGKIRRASAAHARVPYQNADALRQNTYRPHLRPEQRSARIGWTSRLAKPDVIHPPHRTRLSEKDPMKKYLSLAALLGLIAFVSVSYLAQAQNETSKAKTAIEQAMEGDIPSDKEGAETLVNTEADAVSSEVAKFMQSVEACEGILAA